MNEIITKLEADIKQAENAYTQAEILRKLQQRNDIIKAFSIITLVIVCGISLVYGINEYRRSIRKSRRKHKQSTSNDMDI